MSDPASSDAHAKVHDLIKDLRTCMFSTVGPDGRIVSRPMATQQTELNGQLWFFAAADSPKALAVQQDAHVNVAYSGSSSWVSVSGTAQVVHDQTKVDELWNPVVEAWFPNGKDDPNIVLLRVDADTVEYWDSPGGRVATVLSLVKAKVTGKPYDDGENETVQM